MIADIAQYKIHADDLLMCESGWPRNRLSERSYGLEGQAAVFSHHLVVQVKEPNIRLCITPPDVYRMAGQQTRVTTSRPMHVRGSVGNACHLEKSLRAACQQHQY